MSWQLASFAVIGLVLAVGWLAYERRRPSARMAAVVAVMAALAALGRDAFAALPDVKPITAMTLVVGYALGPLPGFTVGALGMLVSNFMLGQGPYTPWQMAAWGMVGLGGAVLGWLSRRRLGRVQLALACGLSALAAKEVMNLYTWTLGASHTPAAFLAVAGQALAYDITDTVASFLFGLAFAPELARVLARMRARMDVTWVQAPPLRAAEDRVHRRGDRALGAAGTLAALAVAATLLLGGAHATAGPASQARPVPVSQARLSAVSPARVAVSRELAFLAGAQNADGGFGGARGQSSSELYTGWVAMGLAAAGRDPLSLRRGGHTVLDALRAEASSVNGAGDLERTILALRACGASPRSLPGGPGGDPVRRLLGFRSSDGSFGHLSNLTAFAILALRAAGYPAASQVVRGAAGWLARQQNGGGGFGFGGRGGGSDVDDTAAVVQAIAAAGAHGGAVLARASTYLIHAQNRDGGYPQQPGGQSNAQSTAWAVQGLIAAGRNVGSVTREGSRSPLGYLQSLLAPDGSVRYSRTGAQTPVWVTAQALTALAGKPLPIAPVAGRASPSSAGPGGMSPAGGAHGRSARSAAAGRPAPKAASTAQTPSKRLDTLARAMGLLLGTALAPIAR
ncbi:MAG: energy-coupling factor transport system substrate-specific component [Solirubrobacteraceae bacterium]|nr:energy-coupling factor transport system substrate-specific component [Solirubrobacteraceae bacterium]